MKPRLVTPNSPRDALSPARSKLADLHRRVADHEAAIAEHRAAADRLDGVITADQKARAELDQFDANSAAAAVEWAKSLHPTPPTVDTAHRAELQRAATSAQESAAAATTARQQFVAAINTESRAIEALKVEIDQIVAEVIAEEAAGPMLEDLQQAVSAAVAKQIKLQGALNAIINIAHSGDREVMRPTFILMENLADTLRLAAAPPAPDGFADRAAWLKFAMDLRTDAGARL